MSIELPPIPPQPGADSGPAEWARYLDIARLHVSRESSEAIDRQTAQMVRMTTAAERNAVLMQQFLDQPPAPAPAPLADGAHRVVVAALMTEGGADKPPAEVATAVRARVAAVDSMLSGEAPAP